MLGLKFTWHVVSVQDFVLDPFNRLLCGVWHSHWVGEVSLVNHRQARHRLLADLELLVQGALLDEVEKILGFGDDVKIFFGCRHYGE